MRTGGGDRLRTPQGAVTFLVFATRLDLICSCLLLLLSIGLVRECGCLRDVRLQVPEAVKRGESVKLVCEYDLERAALYSIKWYKGDEEFFRFVPKEAPPTRVFPMPGVNVDVSRSGARAVVLSDVQRELTAFYKCEVSTDAPLFHTEVRTALMLVVDLPQDAPFITTEKLRYAVDEPIAANCTSPGSFPAANLTWFVNGMQIQPSGMWILEAGTDEGRSLETAIAELRLPRPVFRAGRLTLRCRASLYALYHWVTDVDLHLDEPAPQEVSPLSPASVRHQDAASHAPRKLKGNFFLTITSPVLSILLLLSSSCLRLHSQFRRDEGR